MKLKQRCFETVSLRLVRTVLDIGHITDFSMVHTPKVVTDLISWSLLCDFSAYDIMIFIYAYISLYFRRFARSLLCDSFHIILVSRLIFVFAAHFCGLKCRHWPAAVVQSYFVLSKYTYK